MWDILSHRTTDNASEMVGQVASAGLLHLPFECTIYKVGSDRPKN